MNHLHPSSLLFFSPLTRSSLPASFLHLLPSFHPFMSARQLPPPFLLSIDFLLSFCPSLPSSTPSRTNIHPHLSFYASLSLGFPSLHLSVLFCVAPCTQINNLCRSFLFHLFLFSSFHFLPPSSPPARKPSRAPTPPRVCCEVSTDISCLHSAWLR